MPKPELGTKRVCPETERKFYDLNRDPIVSPYTGNSYPLSFFEAVPEPVKVVKPAPVVVEEKEEKETEGATVEIVSLEDADDEAADTGETIPDIEGDDDDDDVDISDDDDTFLATDDDDEDDMTTLVNVTDDKEET